MAKKATNSNDLEAQAAEILKLAEKYNVESNYFFRTTFERYQVQLELLKKLEEELRTDGVSVTKEYVKGRTNLYAHPAIKEYNSTSTAANQTVTTLMKIIQLMKPKTSKLGTGTEPEDDAFTDFLRTHK